MSGDVEENPGPPKKQVPSLGPDGLNDVRKELWDISAKWYDIGLELRLRAGVLENLRYRNQDASTCLREMLFHWLKKVDPPPTWEGLACALESRTVGEPRLAEELRTKYCKTEGAAETRGHDAGLQPQILTVYNNRCNYYTILWIMALLLLIALSLIPVFYELQEIRKKLAVVVSVTPPTADLNLKEVLYDSGSYLMVKTFGRDYAIHLQYLAPDYGRVILDLYNSDTGDVVQHSNIRYSGCGLYRESNVIVLNSLLDGEWGKVERPRGFPFHPGQETSYIVTTTEDAYVILSQSGGLTFKYYYQYRSKTEPENIDRIDAYVLEYRDCLPLTKGKVLSFSLGKQINEFRLGTVVTVNATAPPSVGQTLGISVIKGASDIVVMEEPSRSAILHVNLASGIDVSAGAKFTLSIVMTSQYVVQVSVNGGPHQSYEVKVGISSAPHVVSVWVTGVYELDRIESV